MTHDPMCPVYVAMPENQCGYCHLIKRVRADERARWQPPLPVTAGHVAACFCPLCLDGDKR